MNPVLVDLGALAIINRRPVAARPLTPTESLGRAMQAADQKRLSAFTAPAAPQRANLAKIFSPRMISQIERMGLDADKLAEEVTANLAAHRDPRTAPSATDPEVQAEIKRMEKSWGVNLGQKGGK